MAKCEICGKGVTFGIKVSHSHRRANKAWKPNVRRVKAIVNGTPTKVYACTRCLRSGKVNRAVQSFSFLVYDDYFAAQQAACLNGLMYDKGLFKKS